MSGTPSAGRFAAVTAVLVGIVVLGVAMPTLAQPPGGWVEKADSAEVRTLWTTSDIQAFLPARGLFTFPEPYGTEGIRITNSTDCGDTDCVTTPGGSHWRNINSHAGSDSMLILLGLKGIGPTLFRYDKWTGEVEKLGAMFEPASPFATHSGEGWYFSATQPTTLYVSNGGPELLRYDVQARTFQTVFDATTQFGGGRYLWRTHSSDDDNVHSAVLRDVVSGESLGCVAYQEDAQRFFFHSATESLQECQVDRSGRWLLIKEDVDGLSGTDNRVIDLETGAQTLLLDDEGAAGGSDNGHGYMVASDDRNALPGAVRFWDFAQSPLDGPLAYHTMSWDVDAGHLSHANAQPGVSFSEQYACGGGATTAVAPRANELVCFRLDTSLDVLVVTQNMTDLSATGGGDGDAKLPKGNLDVTGGYFIWVSNMGGDRADAFMVKVPAHLLTPSDDAAGVSEPSATSTATDSEVSSAETTGEETITSSSVALPQVFLDTTYAPPSGNVILVNAGGSLQNAINNAQPGDIIQLEAGATFSGNFSLPNKTGTGWIYIRSSAHASLPAPGNRVFPSHASLMAKIVTTNSSPALQTAAAAHHYRFVGIEITGTHTSTSWTLTSLVYLEAAGGQTSLSQVPRDIIFDRCYIHGTPTGNYRRGIALNSARTAVIDSYLSDFHETGADSQALSGWNGPGPFKIVNNYLSGAGENLMFGGADPKIKDLVPSDIEVRGNHFFKPLSWKAGDPSYAGIDWSIKNIFELKNAQRVLVEGNVFEHNWPDSQTGFSILFTPRNQEGTAPWSVVQDVTFVKNILRHVAAGFSISSFDDIFPSQQTKRILIRDNLMEDIGWTWGGAGRPFLLLTQAAGGFADVTIDHNTGFESGSIAYTGDHSTKHTGFTFRNNVFPKANYGFTGGGTGDGNTTLNTYYLSPVFTHNALIGASSSSYSSYPGNFFPATISDVGFVDYAAGNYRLSSSSPYKSAGTDGKDLGADISALNTATSCAITGACGAAPPSDTQAPTVSVTSPSSGAIVSGSAVSVSASASDNVGVVGVQFKLDGGNLGSEDLSAPFAVSWNTTLSLNGSHSLTAVARDAAGNRTTSSAISVTIDNPIDSTAPVISAVASSGITSAAATITWTTNELSDSQVEYGPTTGYGSSTALNSLLVTSHSQALSGLSANTLYHYRVKSRDAAGNLATSGDFSFTTLSSAQSPYLGSPFAVPGLIQAEDFDLGGEGVAYHDNVAGNAGGAYRTAEDVDILFADGVNRVNNFETGEWLEYTISVGQTGTYRIELEASSGMDGSRFHVEVDGVSVTGSIVVPKTGGWTVFQLIGQGGISLNAGQHVLRIHSDQQYFDLNAIRISSETVADTQAPTVSVSSPSSGATVSGTITVSASASDNVGVAGVQFKLDGANLGAEDTSAPYSVSWNTTLASNGSHGVTAVARDAAGNTAISSAVNVTVSNDSTAPVLSSVTSSGITASAATITWTTNEAADTQVEYGQTTAYGSSTTLNTTLVTSHGQTLSGLASSTLYHYRVKSRDAAGNLAVSGDFTFMTADGVAPIISAVSATSLSPFGATILWTTNEPADTQVEYGTTTAYGSSTTRVATLVTAHSQALAGLAPATLYHYRVKSRDAAGNLATSADFTFTTLPVDTLALFNPSQGQVSLIASSLDLPPPGAYTTYVAGAPVQGQWVMGDWNGDGTDTPAVYGDNGAFFYTNDVGATANWIGIWFGFLGKPAVAGRFDATVGHDCLGVVDSTPWAGYGTAFAAYSTCDLTSGPNPPKLVQWIGPVLADSAGFTGEHQFAAGDFDRDGVDSLAARRGPHIAWTNVPPTILLSEFSLAQYIGAPAAGTGQVVAADWDGDGIDSFGLFYPDGSLYRRNDLEWNSGLYTLQRVGQPVGTPVTAASWRAAN